MIKAMSFGALTTFVIRSKSVKELRILCEATLAKALLEVRETGNTI